MNDVMTMMERLKRRMIRRTMRKSRKEVEKEEEEVVVVEEEEEEEEEEVEEEEEEVEEEEEEEVEGEMDYFSVEMCVLLSPTELSVGKPRPVARSVAGLRGYLPSIKNNFSFLKNNTYQPKKSSKCCHKNIK